MVSQLEQECLAAVRRVCCLHDLFERDPSEAELALSEVVYVQKSSTVQRLSANSSVVEEELELKRMIREKLAAGEDPNEAGPEHPPPEEEK